LRNREALGRKLTPATNNKTILPVRLGVEKLRMETNLLKYLEPGRFIDSNSAIVVQFSKSVVAHETTAKNKAIKLYYAVRDKIRYNPYRIDMSKTAMKASSILKKKSGYCVQKAVLLAALARAEGIPSRLGFADVKNHLTTKRLKELMKSDIYLYHGYTELYLENRWVKATPAFNLSLCRQFGVDPLEFDGKNDSIFQPLNSKGNRYMEYIHYHGEYAELPYQDIAETMIKHYPFLMSNNSLSVCGDFEMEAGEIKE